MYRLKPIQVFHTIDLTSDPYIAIVSTIQLKHLERASYPNDSCLMKKIAKYQEILRQGLAQEKLYIYPSGRAADGLCMHTDETSRIKKKQIASSHQMDLKPHLTKVFLKWVMGNSAQKLAKAGPSSINCF